MAPCAPWGLGYALRANASGAACSVRAGVRAEVGREWRRVVCLSSVSVGYALGSDASGAVRAGLRNTIPKSEYKTKIGTIHEIRIQYRNPSTITEQNPNTKTAPHMDSHTTRINRFSLIQLKLGDRARLADTIGNPQWLYPIIPSSHASRKRFLPLNARPLGRPEEGRPPVASHAPARLPGAPPPHQRSPLGPERGMGPSDRASAGWADQITAVPWVRSGHAEAQMVDEKKSPG